MKACIITIGDELLQGFTLDTNSNWISKQLSKHHVDVGLRLTIPDSDAGIHSALNNVLDNDFEYVFITGGLGPTHDDITRNSLKEFFNCDLNVIDDHHESLIKWISQRGRKIPSNLKSQSTILSISTAIANSIGSALGMKLRSGKTTIFVMPGVPAEMKKMMTDYILPENFTRPDDSQFITIRTSGMGESIIFDKISHVIDKFGNNIKVAFLPSHRGVNIRLKNLSSDLQKMVKLKDEISKVLQSIIFTEDDRDLQEVTGQMLSDRRLTLSIAESCTGGLISKLFTDQPGSSAFLLGGVIAYHNDLKMDLLKVSAETLENVGAVSEETAKAMALNIREITGSDFAISTTGISGPGGGTEDKPVGLVYIGMSDANGVIVKKFNFLKNRKLHREMTAATAINMLRLLLLEKYSTT